MNKKRKKIELDEFNQSILQYKKKIGKPLLNEHQIKNREFRKKTFLKKIYSLLKAYNQKKNIYRTRAITRNKELCRLFLTQLSKKFPSLKEQLEKPFIGANPKIVSMKSFIRKKQKGMLVREVLRTGEELNLLSRIALFSEILRHAEKQLDLHAKLYNKARNKEKNKFLLKHLFLEDYFNTIALTAKTELKKMLARIK